jgi:hypothetical protein
MGTNDLAFSATLNWTLIWWMPLLKVIMKRKDYLASGSCWKMTAPKNFNQFLRGLPQILPSGSVLCIEASSTPAKVLEFLRGRKTETTRKLPRGTLFPKSDMFHLAITDDNLRGLEAVITASNSPGIPTHIQAYNHDSILIQWFDASANDPIFVSKSISENTLKDFCDKLGCEFSATPN